MSLPEPSTPGPAGRETERDTVEIPENLLVACPLAGFALTRVSGCATCPCFGGLEQRFGPGLPFHQRYLLLCFEEPVKRKMTPIWEG